jgi:hypothetical protein
MYVTTTKKTFIELGFLSLLPLLDGMTTILVNVPIKHILCHYRII